MHINSFIQFSYANFGHLGMDQFSVASVFHQFGTPSSIHYTSASCPSKPCQLHSPVKIGLQLKILIASSDTPSHFIHCVGFGARAELRNRGFNGHKTWRFNNRIFTLRKLRVLYLAFVFVARMSLYENMSNPESQLQVIGRKKRFFVQFCTGYFLEIHFFQNHALKCRTNIAKILGTVIR